MCRIFEVAANRWVLGARAGPGVGIVTALRGRPEGLRQPGAGAQQLGSVVCRSRCAVTGAIPARSEARLTTSLTASPDMPAIGACARKNTVRPNPRGRARDT